MGTRNITSVKVNGRIKVVQYGQWDGYPQGQGLVIANFLKDLNLKKFKEKVEKLKNYSDKEVDEIWAKEGASGGMASLDVSSKVSNKYPELSRDTGAEILKLINDGEVTTVHQSLGQLRKSWIEYLYEVDLDNERVRVSLNGGRTFVVSVPFKDFTPEYMSELDRELSR